MAVRGCVTLFFFLLSGIVHADYPMTSPLPAAEELSASELPPVVLTTTALPTSTHQTTNATTVAPTTTHQTTNATTVAPTTTHQTTNATTVAPTTTHQTNATTVAPTTHKTNATTVAPTTHQTNATTVAPTTMHPNTTNSTTQAPTTTHPNATTAPTPPPTTPPVPNPSVGNYSVKSDNVSSCILAKMGLQFSFKLNGSLQTLNLDPSPNVTEASGTCGIGGSDSSLVLKSKEMTVHFVFTNVSQKFHLHALAFYLGNGSTFNDSNQNLSLWEASFGSSYMCRKEQTYNISDNLTVKTFELQVQPFAVQNNMFGTAYECSMDDTSLLIPIIVGAALAGLIIIVVIAYVIGRRRTYVGYQTL